MSTMPTRSSTYRARLALARPGVYPIVRTLAEVLCAAAFVVGVYELVVRGGIALWPTATDDWILPMWIAAATISGIGLTPVRRLARRLLARLWPSGAADPYAALASFAVSASAAEPAESALRRLAQLTAAGTGARDAAVWLAEPAGGLRLVGRWPDDEPLTAPLPDHQLADYDIPVLDGDTRLGALTLSAPPTRALTPRDLRLAADAANAAGLLLRNAELTARLADEVWRESEQAALLDLSRRRVVAARDAAREQLGREIRTRVGEPLYQCSAMASSLLDADPDTDTKTDADADADPGDSQKQTLAEMTALIDAAIGDFRKIVHGVYPAVLTDHGLAAALDNLLADLPRRTVFTARDLPRVAPRIEAGVYFCVAALVGSTPDSGQPATDQPLEVHVDFDTDADTLSVVLLDTAILVDTAGSDEPSIPDVLRDRVEALEGELDVTESQNGPRYELTVPVKSPEADAS
jgi:signal transduction histidine kinase